MCFHLCNSMVDVNAAGVCLVHLGVGQGGPSGGVSAADSQQQDGDLQV